jgi:hypothetical protein|tara:strand:+ start:271 stop:423 length:153 start_codon:yes stop_codon:yes gene_type:complete
MPVSITPPGLFSAVYSINRITSVDVKFEVTSFVEVYVDKTKSVYKIYFIE